MMNSKKVRSTKEENSNLLIAYSGPDEVSGSESDNLQPLELPPTRLRRPKSSYKKIRVGSSSKSCCSVWALCQVLFVIVIIGVTALMIYFTVVLKTSIDNMKSQVSSLESYDRSSTREYTSLKKDVTKKITGLRNEEAKKSVVDDAHYKSLIAQIAYLNKTVKELSLRAKSPKSVVSISKDIDQLKKGMADTGEEITAVRDTVTKLTKLAHFQNRALKSLRKEFYNLSSEVARVTGKPKPTAPTTGTVPLILRMPIMKQPTKRTGSNSEPHATRQLFNISLITSEIKQVITVVRKINDTFVDEAKRLKTDLDGIKSVFEKHKVKFATIEKQVNGLEENFTKATPGVGSSVEPEISKPDLETSTNVRLGSQIHNLTRTVKKVADFLLKHQKKFYKMEQDVVEMNKTLYRHHAKLGLQSVATSVCNCTKESSAVKELWHNISYEHQHLLSLHSKLEKLENLTLQFVKRSKGHSVKDDKINNIPGASAMNNSHPEKTKQSGKKDLSQEVHSSAIQSPLPTTKGEEVTTTEKEKTVALKSITLPVSSVPTPNPTSKTNAGEKEYELEHSLENRR